MALDPRTWRGLGILGLNQLPARRADRGGPHEPGGVVQGRSYNVWIKERARLLDTFPKYKETDRALPDPPARQGSGAARAVHADLAEDGYAHLSARATDIRPTRSGARSRSTPITRTSPSARWGLAGLAGLGASPPCSPSTRPPREVGQFNWGLDPVARDRAHLHAQLTGNRVRWFTEGLSVTRSTARAAGLGRRRDRGLPPRAEGGRAAAAGRPQPRLHPCPKGPSRSRTRISGLRSWWSGSRRSAGSPSSPSSRLRDGRSTEQAFQSVLGTHWRISTRRSSAQLGSASPAAGRHPSRHQGIVGLGVTARAPAPRDVEARARRTPATSRPSSPRAGLFHAQARGGPPTERAQPLPRVRGEGEPHFYLAAIYKDQGKPLDRYASSAAAAIADGHLPHAARAGAPPRGPGRPEGGGRLPQIAPLHLAVRARRPREASALSTARRPRGSRARPPRAGRSRSRRPAGSALPARAGPGRSRRCGGGPAKCCALEIAPRFQRAQELLLRLHDARAGAPQ